MLYYLSFCDNSCLELLEKIDQYCAYLEVVTQDFGLQSPACLYNVHIMMKSYCQKKWLNTFPSFDFVYDKLVKREKLFSVPIDELHYLYFHFLNTYNELSKIENFNFIDSDKYINYKKISYYLTANNLDAVEFFKSYLNKDDSKFLKEYESFFKLDKIETVINNSNAE